MIGHTAVLVQKKTLIDPPSLARALRKYNISRMMVTASLTKNMLELVADQLRDLGDSHGLRYWLMVGEVWN